MSGILQDCPRCGARWVRLFWHINLRRHECTECGHLPDSALRREAVAERPSEPPALPCLNAPEPD